MEEGSCSGTGICSKGTRNEWGRQPMRCCEGDSAVPPSEQPLRLLSAVALQTHRQTHEHGMIPDGGEPSSREPEEKEDGMVAGYRECATEALNWLLGLGYEPGHPLIRSLAAHLTKKQAYLEKLSLERFLIEETFRSSVEELEEESDVDPEAINSRYELCTRQIMNNEEIQKALVDAVFKGCDLRYGDP